MSDHTDESPTPEEISPDRTGQPPHPERFNDPTAEALEIDRRAERIVFMCSTDRQFRTVRRALSRIGATVSNLGTYSLRAEFGTESEAFAVERLIQTAGALGVRNRTSTAPETGLPVPPVPPDEPSPEEPPNGGGDVAPNRGEDRMNLSRM